ncbi:hypothetical protein COBT_001474 [Conglomerata obtusa]
MIKLDENNVNITVAFSEQKRGIGYKNDLPWGRLLNADRRFIELLTANQNAAIIMGRKTFESIGRPLKNRVNIILTREKNIEGCITFLKLDDAIVYCKNARLKAVIFGGENVYKEALNMKYKLFCTVVKEKNFNVDTYFPETKCNLVDISSYVNKYLLDNNVKQTWNYDDVIFSENDIQFTFYVGEN